MEEGEDRGARDRLAYTAHVSGIALANAGLGVVHGLAGPLGGETGAPHGTICARLLPPALRALDTLLPAGGTSRDRLTEVCDLVERIVPGGLPSMEGWLCAHGLPPAQGLSGAVRDRAAEAARASSSMKASPVQFGPGDLADLLDAAFPEPHR
jgi:hypothetical protein